MLHSGRRSSPAAKHWFAGQMGVEAGAGLALSACHLSVQIATVTMTSRATMCWAYCAEDPVLSLSQTGSLSGSPLELPSLVCSSHVSFNVQRTHQARFHLRAFAPAVPLPKCSPPPVPQLPPLLKVLALGCLSYHCVQPHGPRQHSPLPFPTSLLSRPPHQLMDWLLALFCSVSPLNGSPPQVGSFVLFMAGSPAPNTGLE